jgi:phosphoribosylaminoimidazole-succinocarboxamide synthase
MTKTIYNKIFDKLQKIGILNADGKMEHGYMKFKAPGFMDLSVDRLRNLDASQRISLAHNGIQNGDVMADPDMEIAIRCTAKEAEALTFQNDYMGVYQEVYPEPGKVRPALKKDLNDFLNQWLTNIIDQGHTLEETRD